MRYQFLCRQKDNAPFFQQLANYIKYVNETPEFQKVILDFKEKKDKDFEKLHKLEKQSLAELNVSREKILKIVKKNNICDDFLNGRLEPGRMKSWSSKSKPDQLNDYLSESSMNLSANGHEGLLKNFIDDNNETNCGFIFSKSLKAFSEEENKVKDKKKRELWGTWYDLDFFYLYYHKGAEAYKEFEDREGFGPALYFGLLNSDTEKIEKNYNLAHKKLRTSRAFVSNSIIMALDEEIYKAYVFNLHMHLKETGKKPEKSKESDVTEPQFDEQSGKLSFGNKNCKLLRESMQYKLVEFLYDNPNIMHSYGEIAIKIGVFKKMAYKTGLSEWIEKAEKFEDNDAQVKEMKTAVKRIDTNFQILTPIKKKIIGYVSEINKNLEIKGKDKQQLFECNNGYMISRQITPNTSSKNH